MGKFKILRCTKSIAKLMLKRVKCNSLMIQHVKNPSKEIQIAAVERLNSSIFSIKEPCAEAMEIFLKNEDNKSFVGYERIKKAYRKKMLEKILWPK